MYKSAKELLEYCNANGLTIPQCVRLTEKEIVPNTNNLDKTLLEYFKVMNESTHKTLNKEIPSISGLTGGDAKKLYEYSQKNDTLCGKGVLLASSYALSTAEVNVSMGVITACPTAGASGIVPSVLTYILGDNNNQEVIANALLVAGAIGQIIELNATISGSTGGCQAECGSGAAMASGMAVWYKGGTNEQIFNASALTLKSLLGLVCDPVAGLVEVPCIKRNASCVALALLCADMSLSGIKSVIPFDDVVEAMNSVGKSMSIDLKETSLGGLANTITGKKIKKDLLSKLEK